MAVRVVSLGSFRAIERHTVKFVIIGFIGIPTFAVFSGSSLYDARAGAVVAMLSYLAVFLVFGWIGMRQHLWIGSLTEETRATVTKSVQTASDSCSLGIAFHDRQGMFRHKTDMGTHSKAAFASVKCPAVGTKRTIRHDPDGPQETSFTSDDPFEYFLFGVSIIAFLAFLQCLWRWLR
jgi:hypothetical protein